MVYTLKTELGLEATISSTGSEIRPSELGKEFIIAYEGRGCEKDALTYLLGYHAKEVVIMAEHKGAVITYHLERANHSHAMFIELVRGMILNSNVLAVLYRDNDSDQNKCWVPRIGGTDFGDVFIEQDKSETDDWSRETGQVFDKVGIDFRF